MDELLCMDTGCCGLPCTLFHYFRLLNALPVVSMLMLKLPTRDNMESAAHNSVCDTKITRAKLEATI